MNRTFDAALLCLFEAALADLRKQPQWDMYTHKIEADKKITPVSSKFFKSSFDLGADEFRIEGIHSAKIVDDPRYDWTSGRFRICLGFDLLYLTVSDWHCNSTWQIVSRQGRGARTGTWQIKIKDVQISLSGVIDVDFAVSHIAFNDLVFHCESGKVYWEKGGGAVFRAMTPLFAPMVRYILSCKINKILPVKLNSRMKSLIAEQRESFALIAKAYTIKISQGGWAQQQCPRALQGFGGVGQYPLPTLWRVPEVDSRISRSRLEEVMTEARTGDLVLFSGILPSSMRIKRMTQSPFSHVVMLIKEPEFYDGRCLAWQATASEHACVLRNMDIASGVQLNFLEDVIEDYLQEAPGSVIAFRRFMQDGNRADFSLDMRKKLVQYIRLMDGKPYTDNMDLLYLLGLFEVEDPGSENYYCAGLVAESLMKVDVLDASFLQHQYTPRDFSSLQCSLPYKNNFYYHDSDIILVE